MHNHAFDRLTVAVSWTATMGTHLMQTLVREIELKHSPDAVAIGSLQWEHRSQEPEQQRSLAVVVDSQQQEHMLLGAANSEVEHTKPYFAADIERSQDTEHT